MAGRQRPDSGATGDEQASQAASADQVEPVSDRARARAERRAERRRRSEERRRRWSSGSGAEAGRPGHDEQAEPAADGGGTAVLTREDDPDGPEGHGSPERPDTPDDPTDPAVGSDGGADPTTASAAAPARGPAVLWQLALTAHPRQAALTATAMAAAATIAGRAPAEVGTLAAMVLVGQSMLGWHNDLVDRDRDAAALAAERTGAAGGAEDEGRRPRPKPVAEGRLEPGTVWYALALALLLLAPLSVANGVNAALAYAVVLVVGMLGNVVLRGGWLSWLPWAASFALYPAVLAYAGPPGTTDVTPPQPALVVLAGLLGVVLHVLRALPGLVQDHRDGMRHLPLRIALRTGAPRLLVISSVLAVGLAVALVVTGARVGLTL